MVVGVTTYHRRDGQNLNFAVPVKRVLKLINTKEPLQTRASTGGEALDKDAASAFDRAWDAMAKKDWSEAVTILNELRQTQQDNSTYWFTRGYLHGKLGNHDLAVAAYKQAIPIKPDHAEAYVNMGIASSKMVRYSTPTGAGAKVRQGATQPEQLPDWYRRSKDTRERFYRNLPAMYGGRPLETGPLPMDVEAERRHQIKMELARHGHQFKASPQYVAEAIAAYRQAAQLDPTVK